MKSSFNPPKIIKLLFDNFIWNTSNSKILFTFDDGPNVETTPIILKKLNDLKIKSVFFCVGNNLTQYPSLIDEILSEGHSIGNHTWNHKKVTDFKINDYQEEISQFNFYMLEKFNYRVKLFRPPHGRFNFGFYRNSDKHQLKVIMWSLLTYDYKNDLKVVKFALQNYLSHNSIIVM
ncbi:MAG: polysaccharide deacetylase family protein, partial [Ignavibacteriaceae bacterium]|nr:polysaccharide deacetylase family protein [Ignavibacteriaceae bacterium]